MSTTSSLNDLFVFEKNSQDKLSKYFYKCEFDCRCENASCDTTKISKKLVERLDAIRDYLKKPIVITSGFRCEKRQQELKKLGFPTSKNKSTHEQGLAVDFMCMKIPGKESAIIAKKFGFKAIGVARDWIHVDMRDDKEREWAY